MSDIKLSRIGTMRGLGMLKPREWGTKAKTSVAASDLICIFRPGRLSMKHPSCAYCLVSYAAVWMYTLGPFCTLVNRWRSSLGNWAALKPCLTPALVLQKISWAFRQKCTCRWTRWRAACFTWWALSFSWHEERGTWCFICILQLPSMHLAKATDPEEHFPWAFSIDGFLSAFINFLSAAVYQYFLTLQLGSVNTSPILLCCAEVSHRSAYLADKHPWMHLWGLT